MHMQTRSGPGWSARNSSATLSSSLRSPRQRRPRRFRGCQTRCRVTADHIINARPLRPTASSRGLHGLQQEQLSLQTACSRSPGSILTRAECCQTPALTKTCSRLGPSACPSRYALPCAHCIGLYLFSYIHSCRQWLTRPPSLFLMLCGQVHPYMLIFAMTAFREAIPLNRLCLCTGQGAVHRGRPTRAPGADRLLEQV